MRHRTTSGRLPDTPAGVLPTFTPSTDGVAKVVFIGFVLVTDATANNRVPSLSVINTSGDVVWEMGSPGSISGSDVVHLQGSTSYSDLTDGQRQGGAAYCIGLPDVWLPPGYTIAVTTAGGGPGDTYSQGTWLAEFGGSDFERDRRMIALEAALQALASQS